MKCTVIIPVLNPDNKLIGLVNEFLSNDIKDIIIVDDGSDKENLSVYNNFDSCVKVYYHKKNKGKGAAIKTGISNLGDVDAFVTVDGDGQHRVKDVIKVIKSLQYSDVVFGSRNFKKKNVPLKSIIGNRFSSLIFFLTTFKKCRDTQTGLRAINIKYKDLALSTKGDRYEYEMNFLYNIVKKTNIKFVNIDTVYEDDNKGSHFKIFRDSFLVHKRFFIILILLVVFIALIFVVC